MRLVCLDPFMSHVLEKLLILKSFCKSDAVIKSDNSSEWLLKVCRFVTNNAEDFCHDTYASHLLRTCTECLMGLRAAQTGGNQSRTQGYDERAVWRLAGDQELVKECDEVLEIVTNVVGELEEVGEDLVNELGLYQKGKSPYQGGRFIGRLVGAVIRFIRRWTGTKQQLAAIVEQQQAVQGSLEATDGQDR